MLICVRYKYTVQLYKHHILIVNYNVYNKSETTHLNFDLDTLT